MIVKNNFWYKRTTETNFYNLIFPKQKDFSHEILFLLSSYQPRFRTQTHRRGLRLATRLREDLGT